MEVICPGRRHPGSDSKRTVRQAVVSAVTWIRSIRRDADVMPLLEPCCSRTIILLTPGDGVSVGLAVQLVPKHFISSMAGGSSMTSM